MAKEDSTSTGINRVIDSLRDYNPRAGQEVNTQSRLNEIVKKNLELETENRNLADENSLLRDELDTAIKLWRDAQSQIDKQDPNGYCKVLGANLEILRNLTQEQAENYLKRLRNAQAFISHTDTGVGNHETMKAVNSAYEFLVDQNNRARYGRS